MVLDFGGQYAHLIANRIRRLGVYAEVRDPASSVLEVRHAKGFILSGGPASVYGENAPAFNEQILGLGRPVLGICYGHQLLMHVLGGQVLQGKTHEFGVAELSIQSNPLFEGLRESERVWMSHADSVQELPQGFKCIGSTRDCAGAAVHHPGKNFFGLQFHPEVTHTENGMKILENFLRVCACKHEWGIPGYLDKKIQEIRVQVGGKKVFLLASGGVDSTVCLALLNRAVGSENVKALHIDNGFMRAHESERVIEALHQQGFSNFVHEDASGYFLEKTHGLIDPEEKRKAIGNAFIEVQQRALSDLRLNGDEWVLGQGTIYPDTIESGRTRHAKVIKTHHNRVQAVQELIAQGKVIEPLDELYKDEVRALGLELGLPLNVVQRHPFPGPGLAVRVLCSNGQEPGVPREVQDRVNALAMDKGFTAVILPLKSVGVQGDNRTYQHVAVLKGKGSWKELEALSTRITNEVREINRVAWLVKGIVTPRTVHALLSKKRLGVARNADALVGQNLHAFALYDSVWQFPVVLAPLECGQGEAVILRPVNSTEAMTARFAELPMEFVEKVSTALMGLEGVGAVLYDVTHKPPGTIEWE